MNGCDLCGFNILNFDLPLLEHEFERAGMKFLRKAGGSSTDDHLPFEGTVR
jgi:hypothetical protein